MANTLPADFRPVLDSVWSDIRSGKIRLDSSQALGEAWRRWRKKHGQSERTTQQRRYAYRKSFENPRRRNPSGLRIVHNKLLGGWYVVRGPHQTPLNGRFDSKAEAQAWLKRKNPKNAPRRSARSEANPRQTYQLRTIFVDKGSVHVSPHWTTVSADTELAAVKKFIKQKQLRSKGLLKIGDTYHLGVGGAAIEFKVIPRSEANPIAIYNPGAGLQLIYGRAQIPEVYGVKTSGIHKGKKFVHKFKTDVKIYGLPRGALMIQSLDGSRLWADERDLDKFDTKGE